MSADGGDGSQRAALIGLAHCVEPADAGMGGLVRRHGPVSALQRVRSRSTGLRNGEGIAARLAAADGASADERAHRIGGRIVTRGEAEWPTQLDVLGDQAPFALWVIGAANLRLLALRSVAIVGARACTMYGEEIARSWAGAFSSDRWSVVSGGAYGIDAAAHRGALAAGGATVCVLAGGVDVPYPRAHEALLARIADDGLLVSETPPGEAVRRQRFLSRNRLIAGLSRATVVVEAAVRSGTTTTAHAAHQMSRPVFAVPGPVTSPASAGCHRLIADQEAILVGDPAEVIAVIDFSRGCAAPEARTSDDRDRLEHREATVLDALPSRGSLGLDGLVAASGLGSHDVLAALGHLEAQGWVIAVPDGWRIHRRR